MAYNSRPLTLIGHFTESIQVCHATWGKSLPPSEPQCFHVADESFFFLSFSPLLKFANEGFGSKCQGLRAPPS